MNQSTTSKKETDSLKNKRADAELNSAGKKKTPFIPGSWWGERWQSKFILTKPI